MSNELLATHIPTEIATTTFCLFQIAILRTSMRLIVLTRRIVAGVHAKHNQEFGRGISQAAEDLGKREKPLNSGDSSISKVGAHDVESDQCLCGWSVRVQV
jgi:hypothetical protein